MGRVIAGAATNQGAGMNRTTKEMLWTASVAILGIVLGMLVGRKSVAADPPQAQPQAAAPQQQRQEPAESWGQYRGRMVAAGRGVVR